MENSSTVPTSQDAGSYSRLIAFLTERFDNLERKVEGSTEAIMEKLNELEGKVNNMFDQRVETTTPVSVISQEADDKEEALQGTMKDLFKAGNPKYKTKVLIWTDSETSFEIVSAGDIPNPVLSTTVVDCSVATALRCCGIDDAEPAARAESSENPFTVFAGNGDGEDKMQSNLQAEWERSGSCPLLAACDGRKPNKLPMFLPGGAPNSFDSTGRPDIVSRACPMMMEFTLAATDRELMDGLQQVLQRLHLLFSVNCFIKRSFGFAVNGGTSSFLVSIHRNLVRDQPHWYEDTVHILKIATTQVAGIWNELTKKAQQDLCFVLDRDVFALAATLRAMSQTTPPSASPPPPPPDWDLSRLMGYTKISLKGLSSSRVYGVYPSNVVKERNRTFIRTTATEPVFLVKISHSPDRSCREHSALKRLARNFDSSPWAQLFYVHQSFVFVNWVLSDTAAFSPVAAAGHFATLNSLFSLGITNDAKLARLCLDRPGAIQETCWWTPLLNSRSLPNDTSPVATVVMKHAHRLAFVNDAVFERVMQCVRQWLQRIHTAGVLHTDLRPSNIMWLPVKSGTVTTEIEQDLTLPVDEVLGGAVSPEREARVNRTLESQFDMVLRIEDPPSVAGSCSQDGVVDVPSEITEGATATGGSEATATTEAEETTDNANDAVGVTAATATDHSVTQQELMLPIVIDFDCAELLSEGANSCEVSISVPGARSNQIRKQKRPPEERLSVEWETYDDMDMVMRSLREILRK